MTSDHPTPAVVERYSPRLARFFELWLRRYFAKNFDAVRVCRSGRPPEDRQGPILVYSNHPSWWDPIHFLLLARLVLPKRRMFGPFEAAALEQYGFFQRLGAFGIETTSRRGAADFLRTCRGILEMPDATLWITAQGEFSDPRRRPVELRPGLAHLVRRLDTGLVVPLAVEYPFWNERRPEALSCFGTPIALDGSSRESSVESWNQRLEKALQETMDRLAGVAQERQPALFDSLVEGRTGIGGVYDAWRRAKATMRGETFDASHGQDRRGQ
ncbi:MAG: lysophospholipid acyltransferase family protein [Acidobacteriota bacterium]